MKRQLKYVFTVCLALAVLSSSGCVWGSSLLQYKFVTGQLLRYSYSTVTRTTVETQIAGADQMPEIAMSMSGVMRQRTIKVLPNGDAEVRVAIESMKMEIMGNAQAVDVSKMPVVTMVMSPQGEVKSSTGIDKFSAAFGNGSSIDNMGGLLPSSAFPAKALNIGDSWTQNVPFPMGGKLQVKAQLAAEDGKTATVKQSISGDIDLSQPIPGAGVSINSKGNMSMDGNMVFSTSDGYLIRSDASGSLDIMASAPEMGGDMKFITSMQVKMELMPAQ